MSHLQLALFGPPQVWHNSQLLTFSTRKELALLACLAVASSPHSRKYLTSLLWPESDAVRGRAAFRITLSRLRNALDEPDSPEDANAHLLVQRDTLGLGLNDLTLDLHTLERACSLAQRLATKKVSPLEEESEACLRELEQASRLVRGTFLQDFFLRDAPAFEEWVSSQREFWHVRLCLLFDCLGSIYEDNGAYEQGIEAMTRWLTFDPLYEEGYQRLMRLYEAMGNRRAALQAYEACRALFASELNAAPSTYTTTLAERLRRGTLTERKPSVTVSPAALTLLHPPLIGREREFDTLIEGYRMVQDAGGMARTQVVLLEGEAGVGKTRLAQEFLDWAGEQGGQVLMGRAFEMGGRLPYQPLVHALRPRLDAENAPDDLLSDVWLAELSRLLPELRERYPDLPAPGGEEVRVQLFEAVARLVQAWAKHRPIVLFLDDLHWADSASLDLLVYLIGSWRERAMPVLLMLALRSEVVSSSLELMKWKTALEHHIALTHLVLSPLSEKETQGVVEALAGGVQQGMSQQFGQWLYRETAGQPFYLLETLKVLLERHEIVPRLQDGGWVLDFTGALQSEVMERGVLPPSVRELLRTRIGLLSSLASSLLLAGAVLDQQSTFARLSMVAALDEQESLTALDDLLRQRFFVETPREPAGQAVYIFSHDKLREVAYSEASEARRRIFHRRAFEILLPSGVSAAELVSHARRALLVEQTFRYSVRAGDEAMAVSAVRDAIAQYEQIGDFLPSGRLEPGEGNIAWSEFEHLYVNLGRAYELAGDWKSASATYEKLRQLAQMAHEHHAEWTALNRLAILVVLQANETARATQLLQEALRVADVSGNRALVAETEWNLAHIACIMWEPEPALKHAHAALKLAQELNLEHLNARCLHILAQSYAFAGLWEECVIIANQAVKQYATISEQTGELEMLEAQFMWAGSPPSRSHHNLAMQALGLCTLLIGQVNRGELDAAREAAWESRTISAELHNASVDFVSLLNMGHWLQEVGAFTEVLRGVREASKLASTLLNPTYTFWASVKCGGVLLAMLNLDDAQSALLKAVEISNMFGTPLYRLMAISQLCAISALRGDWVQADLYAQEAIAIRNQSSVVLLWHDFTRWYEVEALLRSGHEEQARTELRIFGERIKTNRRHRIPYLRSLAVLAQWDGELEQALEHLCKAQQLAEQIGLPGELWLIEAALGKIYEALVDGEHAQQAFTRAAEIAQGLAERIDDEALRSQFLVSPQVRDVIEYTITTMSDNK